jgi:hypothetical protein
VVVNGSYYYCTSDGSAFKELAPTDAVPYLDLGQFVPMTLQTGWIKPAGKQGLVRVQRANVLGLQKSEHDLTLKFRKDYVDADIQTQTWISIPTLQALPQEQISMSLQQQVGEAYQFKISDAYADHGSGASPPDNGQGFQARGLTLVAGVKRGSFEKNMGASAKG